MGITQLIVFAMMAGIAVIAFSRTKRLRGAAQVSFAEHVARLRHEFSQSRQPGESEVGFVTAATRNKLSKNHGFYLALTNQRLFLQDPSSNGPLRSFGRSAVSITAQPKKWIDVGNMQAAYSSGWQISINLPNGESYSGLRLYSEDAYYAEQAQNVPPFLSSLGQA